MNEKNRIAEVDLNPELRYKVSNLSNSLKNNIIGDVICIKDASPFEYITDVKLESLNLVNVDEMISTEYNKNFVSNNDGTYTISRESNKRFSEQYKFKNPIPTDATIILSYDEIESTTSMGLYVQFFNAEGEASHEIAIIKNKATLKAQSDIYSARLFLRSEEAEGSYKIIKNFQIKLDLAEIKLIAHDRNALFLDDYDFFIKQEDGSYTNSDIIDTKAIYPLHLSAGRYTITYDLKSDEGDNARLQWLEDTTSTGHYEYKFSTGDYVHFEKTYNFTSDIIGFRVECGKRPQKNTMYIKNIKIVCEDTKIEYTLNKDGIAEKVIIKSPITTLLTDTDDVIINVEYNQDINARLESEITAIKDSIKDHKELDAIVADHGTRIGDLESKMLSVDSNIDSKFQTIESNINQQMTSLSKTITDSNTLFKNEINKEISDIKSANTSFKSEVNQQISTMTKNITDNNTTIRNENTAFQTQINKEISDIEKTVDDNNTAITNRVDNQISTLSENITKYNEEFQTEINGKITEIQTGNTTFQTGVNNQITTMSQTIDSNNTAIRNEVNQRLNNISKTIDVTLSSSKWTGVTSSDNAPANMNYKYEYSISNLLASSFVNVIFDAVSKENALDYGVYEDIYVLKGKIVFFSEDKVEVDLKATAHYVL